MAIFARMLQRLQTVLNRPLAEDFSLRHQGWLSAQAGLYVFLVLYLLGLVQGAPYSPVLLSAMLAVGCSVSSLLANTAIPRLAPGFYDEDHWTIGKHGLHVLIVLLCVTVGNQLVLYAISLPGPSFFSMYTTVTLIGFFPVMLGVFVAEQRRLKRNLAHARTLNQQLGQRTELTAAPARAQSLEPELSTGVINAKPKSIVLASDNGKERLSLQPNQILYVESVGNYVEVHWLNLGESTQRVVQKTVLRSTLKDVVDTLTIYPQFFRCHRAYLVNLDAVCQAEGNARGYQLALLGSADSVPVSRTYLEAFDARFSAHN